MEKKITLREIAPYLPYRLKMAFIIRDEIIKVGVLNEVSVNNSDTHPIRYSIDTLNELEHEWMFKPILRPLSDLNRKEFETIAKELWDKCILSKCIISDGYLTEEMDIKDISYFTMVKLLENHFDVFGLIEKKLAIDINTL